MNDKEKIGILKKILASHILKGIAVLILIFIPFCIYLIDYNAGYREVKLRNTNISCSIEPCSCAINFRQVDKAVEAGFDCPINTYGLGLYFYFFVFTFLAAFVFQLIQKEYRRTFYFIIASILFWILAWIFITEIFHIAVVLDEPKNGDYIIFPSAAGLFLRSFKHFIVQIFFLSIVMTGTFYSGSFGMVLALALKNIRKFSSKILKKY